MKILLERIQSNDLAPRSRTYFRLRFAAFVLVALVALVVTVFLSSFILFSLRASGDASLIGLGPRGWQVFLALFPWNLFMLDVILILIVEQLMRTFRFGYRVPVLYLFLGVACLMLVCGIAVNETSFHTRLLVAADHHGLPVPFTGFYENARQALPSGYGIYRGTVTGMNGTGTLMVSLDTEGTGGQQTGNVGSMLVTVILPSTGGTLPVMSGDRVFIMGMLSQGQIQAEEIIDANDQPPPLPDDSAVKMK